MSEYYVGSSLRLYRDRSNKDYSKLKIYSLKSSKCDKVYINMCSVELEEELKWINDEYIFWTYGGGYVNKVLYDMLSLGGVLSIELISNLEGCKSLNDGFIYLNEVLKCYIDDGKCVNNRLWYLESDKYSKDEKSCLNMNKYKKNEYYVNDLSEDDKLIYERIEELCYSYGKIYKIISENSELCYIGSTVRSLEERLQDHINNYKYYKEGKNSNYISSYEILEKGDISIILLEKCNCKNKEELLSMEGKYILEFGEKCVNMVLQNGKCGKLYKKEKCMDILSKDDMDYKNSIIFCIKSKKSGRYMIGVSIKSVEEMFKLLMNDYEKFKYGKVRSKKLYYDIIEDGDVYMEIVENVVCKSLKELKEREQIVLKSLNGDEKCINKKFKINLL